MPKFNTKSLCRTTISIAFLSLVACKTTKVAKENTLANETPKPKIEKTLVPAYVQKKLPYQPTKNMTNDLIHTKLKVSFDWQKQYLFGEAELTIAPYFYPQNKVVLDAKGFDIQEVALLKSNQKQNLIYTYQDSLHLEIQLDKTYLKAEKYQLYIKYTAKPNELNIKSNSSAISDDKGLYFINPLGEDTTKPRQIWTQGETEASSCWFPTFDQPNEKTTEEIAITVEDNFVTLSNGEMLAQMHNEDGTRTDFWEQTKPHAPYLFMMAIGEFSVIHSQWLAPESGEKIAVNYYVEKDFEPYAKKIFGNTPEMLAFFSKKLGYQYPWDKYSQVVVRDYVSGAMENTSASLFMEALQVTDRELLDKNWDYIIAHELFHHWFGDLVTCESWGNLALNESFATYSEYLWFEYKFGKEYADAHRQEEMDGYLHEAEKKQAPIIRTNYVHRMDMFDNHSYAKGSLVLHMLRDQIGDQAFFESLKHYLHKNQFTDVELDELRLAFEETTGLDLARFFDQWFLHAGHPTLAISQETESDSLKIIIVQEQDSLYTPYYYIPTKVEVSTNGIISQYPVTIEGKETIIKIAIAQAPDYILLDPDQVLLAEIKHPRTAQSNASMYEKSKSYQSRYNALDQLLVDFANTNYALNSPKEVAQSGMSLASLDSLNTQVLAVFISSLQDPSEHIKLFGLEALTGYNAKKSMELRSSYLNLIQNDKVASVRAKAIENLNSIVNAEMATDKEKQIVQKALNDSSYKVLGEAMGASLNWKIEGTEEVILQYEKSDKANLIKAVGKYYLIQKETQKDQWIINAFQKVNSSELISLIETFSSLTAITEVNGQSKLIKFYQQKGIESEDIYTRYTAYRILHALDKIEGVRALRQELIRQEKSAMLLGVYKSWETSLNK